MKSIYLFLLSACFLFVACSPQRKLHNRLVGIWNVTNYQDNSGGSRSNIDNTGTIEFHDDNRGNKDISFRAMQSYRDNTPFTWDNSATTVTIHGDASEFAKAWIVTTNKKRKQVWKSTNGRGGVQQLTMTK